MKHNIFPIIVFFVSVLIAGCKPSQPQPVNPAPGITQTTPSAAVTPPAASTPPTTAGAESATTTPAPAQTAESSSTAKPEAKKTEWDPKDYTYAQKADFVHVMRSELDELSTEIGAMQTQINNASKDLKTAAQAKIDIARAQAQSLKSQLNDAESTAEASWDDFKNRASKTYLDLKQSTTETRTWLSGYFSQHNAL